MTVNAYAAQRHYVDHIFPVWEALPADVRGDFEVRGDAHARLLELGGTPAVRRDPRVPVLVASKIDEDAVRPAPVVLIEHGAGQSYSDHNPGYPGGTDRARVVLFICPNTTVADRWLDMYPSTPVAVVGCPKLDRWLPPAYICPPCIADEFAPGPHSCWDLEVAADCECRVCWPVDEPVVAVTWHWNCPVKPETHSGFELYAPGLRGLIAASHQGTVAYRFLGHAHPRNEEAKQWWPKVGVEYAPTFDEVLNRADVLVVDNSSVAFEFAATDRPVVLMNLPEYRRDVEHGLRFWSHAGIGEQIDHPGELHAAIMRAIRSDPQASARRRLIGDVYTFRDGTSSARAAAAILEHVAGVDWSGWKAPRDAADPFAPHR